MVKFCTDRRLSILHQGRVSPNKVLAVKRKDARIEFGLRPMKHR